MMKKTLLASAIATSLLAAASAQAAVTVFENESTKIENYGRLDLMLTNHDSVRDIEDGGTRIGFRASNKINENLTAFARVEFRFDGSERNRIGRVTTKDDDVGAGGEDVLTSAKGDGELDIRNTYVGLRGSWGSLTVGNFDSIYKIAVSDALDLPENAGYRALVDAGTHARGDTLAFESADLGGFNFGVAVQNYSEGESGDSEINLQGYVQFTGINNLTLALGFDQNNEDADPVITSKPTATKDEADAIIGFSATYELNDLMATLVYETAGDLSHIGLGLSYDYGSGDIYGLASMLDDGDVDGTDFMVGANYKFSRAFRIYGEYAVGEKDEIAEALGSDLNDDGLLTLGMRYDW